jgi:hypothetical protein
VHCYFELAGAPAAIEDTALAAGKALFLEGGAALTEAGLQLPAYGVAVVSV